MTIFRWGGCLTPFQISMLLRIPSYTVFHLGPSQKCFLRSYLWMLSTGCYRLQKSCSDWETTSPTKISFVFHNLPLLLLSPRLYRSFQLATGQVGFSFLSLLSLRAQFYFLIFQVPLFTKTYGKMISIHSSVCIWLQVIVLIIMRNKY